VAGSVTVSTCGQTALDSKIAVYSGSGCPSAAALACNDDFCGLQSSLSFAATKGQAYTIQVGNFPGAAAGTGTFTITYANPATACSYDDGVSEISYTMSGSAGEELAWIKARSAVRIARVSSQRPQPGRPKRRISVGERGSAVTGA
jgi:hypothetical protein